MGRLEPFMRGEARFAPLLGLEEYRLTKTGLFKLGARPVTVTVALAFLRDPAGLIRLDPRVRKARVFEKKRRLYRQVLRSWPAPVTREGRPSRPWGFDSVLAARDLRKARAIRGIEYIAVQAIEGRRRRPTPPNHELRWFGVRVRGPMQRQGQKGGVQSVEDRIYIVKGRSFDDADDRLRRRLKASEEPFLTGDGELFRWHFEAVVDVSEVGEEIDPRGTWVCSDWNDRRMRRPYMWHAFKTQTKVRRRARRAGRTR